MEFITLTCPSCGSKLQIGNNINTFACGYCGTEHIVNRNGGIVSLSPLIEQISNVRTGVDKTASELAIVRLNEEIKNLKSQIPAPVGTNGCLSKFISAFFGIAMFSCLLAGFGALSGESEFIVGGIIAGIIFVAIGIFLIIITAKNNQDRQKPYLMEIEKKEKELAYHKKIVSTYTDNF